MFVLNLTVGLVIELQLPGTAYANPTWQGSVNATEYETHFNATEIAGDWDPSPFSGIPIVGDIFAGFDFLWRVFGYLIDGFPTLLTWIGNSFISDATGRLAFFVITNAIRGVQALLMTLFIIEFISGRVFTD